MLTEICCCCEQYYYVESEGNPETDPLTLWLNGESQRILSPQVDSSLTILDHGRLCHDRLGAGGPGASSIAYGMMTEIGQLVFNRDSLEDNTTAVPVLQYNQFGWSRFSNMLYLESPVPYPASP